MKRKRCTICNKLFDVRGIKRHTAYCIEKNRQPVEDIQGTEEPLPNVTTVVREENAGYAEEAKPLSDYGLKLAEPDTFESIVKELKDANLGLMVITLE
jgi:hypothetical protein